MELRLLQFFHWNISLPTAAHFFEYFLVDSVAASDYFEGRSLGSQASAAVSTLSKYVIYFLEISLQGQQSKFYANMWNCDRVMAVKVIFQNGGRRHLGFFGSEI